MGHIFISYSRADIQAIDRLAATLKEAAIEVWIDREGIDGGAKWRTRIVEAIKSASAFVIALSPDSVKSDNVSRELAVAEQTNKPIVPILLRPTTIPSDLEYTLSQLQRIDLAEDYGAGVKRLLKTLRGRTEAGVTRTGEPRHEPHAPNVPRDTLARSTAAGLGGPQVGRLQSLTEKLYLGKEPSQLSWLQPRSMDAPTPEPFTARSVAILSDLSLTKDEQMKALSEAFPAGATRDEMCRDILADPGLTIQQKLIGFLAAFKFLKKKGE